MHIFRVAYLENLLDDVVGDEEAEDALADEDEEVESRDVAQQLDSAHRVRRYSSSSWRELHQKSTHGYSRPLNSTGSAFSSLVAPAPVTGTKALSVLPTFVSFFLQLIPPASVDQLLEIFPHEGNTA